MADKRRKVANGASEDRRDPAATAESPSGGATVEPKSGGTHIADQSGRGPPAGYEELREQRIKENLDRMRKLGLADLSLKLSAAANQKRASRSSPSDRKAPLRSPSSIVAEPPRRSSRLQSVTPVSYAEFQRFPKEVKPKEVTISIKEGDKPEIYTEEHEKLLGSSESEWTLSVDGFGENGKRIYDPANGKSCHQCRQKTLGQRTSCSKCQTGQGQFCGDCLYMRYGENVLEANKNPDWVCPVCRNICNCSSCRQSKGWLPTGNLYRKVLSLGYKSVAHYLIQTKRVPPETEPVDDLQNAETIEPANEKNCEKEDTDKADETEVISSTRRKLRPKANRT